MTDIHRKDTRWAWCLSVVSMLAIGAVPLSCGDDPPPPPLVERGPGDDVGYRPGFVDVVVLDDGTFIVTGDTGGECVMVEGQCIDLDQLKEQECGSADAQADIVMVDGEVVEVICYPPADSGVSIEEVAVDGEVPQNANGAVITFDPGTDGIPIEGDVRLDAERVALIGNGMDNTIIKGNLILDSNNARVRGVTVEGNVIFDKNSNGASIAFSRIRGNLEINANSVSVLGCHIYGNLDVKGNNEILINNGVSGNLTLSGSVDTCDGNFAFVDGNEDEVIDPVEVGVDLSCAQ